MDNKCKVIAFFLPQYHEIEENNRWWGEGFTEWTHVKGAKPCYSGHVQPQVPICGYYSLLEKATLTYQTNLMNKYGIDGMAYYHYWFEGKLLLEKPVELLRSNPDIKQNFMFMWANHDWYKSIDGKKTILIRQTYGGTLDWNKHYDYFVPFFKDTRYIKVNNRPVVGIYDPDKIENIDKMISLWDKNAKRDGYEGIYVIRSCNHYKEVRKKKAIDQHYMIRQPNVTFDYIAKHRHLLKEFFYFVNKRFMKWAYLKKYDYKEYASCEKKVSTDVSEHMFYSICSGWDNTPRHGNRGSVITDFSLEKFKKNFLYLYEKSVNQNKSFIFINAWNEWAEGMHLEPDCQYGYGLLKAISEVVKSVDKSC